MFTSNMGILLSILVLMFIIRYIFTGSINTKYEDEPYAYKIARNITLTLVLIVSIIGLVLDTFDFYDFSLKWFLIITFISYLVVDIYFDLKYMKNTKEYLIKICQGIIVIPAFYFMFS